MRSGNRTILAFIVLVMDFALIVSAGTAQQDAGKPKSTWDLVRKAQTQKTDSSEKPEAGRVVHFPKGRSLGQLLVQDSNIVRDIQTFYHWTLTGDSEWEYLNEAAGDVAVPAGKRLYLVVNQNGWKDMSYLSNLNPDDLYSLTVPGPYPSGPMPDDRIMPHIAHLTGLKDLGFGNTNISTRGLKYLAELKSLERLSIKGLPSNGLVEIARLFWLKGLYLNDHRLTDINITALEQMKSLEELDLSGGRLSDSALAYVAKLPSLRYLLLSGDGFTDAGMAYIKDSPSLQILHFGSLNRLTDAALVHLSQMPQLGRLTLYWNENITDEGIAHLTKLKSLAMLNIKHSKVTDEGLVHLAKIKTLENLTLPDAGVTDTGIEHIAQLQNLRCLWAGSRSSSPLTDESLSFISTLKNLEELSIGGTGFSDEGMKHIAKLTNLKQLSIFTANQMTNKGLAELAKLELLTNFNLGRRTNVSISGLKSLNSLKNLKSLRVNSIRQDNSILDISGLTGLEDIILSLYRERKGGSFVSDSFKNEDWACLANLTKLKRLQITGNGIDDEGVKHLSSLRNLEFLNIMCRGESRITDEALRYLTNMHKLNRLIVGGGHFTDKALDYLDELPLLTRLELTSDFAFSNQAIREFKQKNPDITRLQLIP